MNDLSEPLRRLYAYLDDLDTLGRSKIALKPSEVKSIATSLRSYVDEIARAADYQDEETEEKTEN